MEGWWVLNDGGQRQRFVYVCVWGVVWVSQAHGDWHVKQAERSLRRNFVEQLLPLVEL